MDIDNVIAGMQISGSSNLPLTDAETYEMRRLGWFVSHDGSWMCWV